MRRGTEPWSESFVVCSGGIVLECTCGERIVLLGQEADWYSEERTVFECGGSEEKLALTPASAKDPSKQGISSYGPGP